jgi:dihydrolipoamide dehydrogenase
MSLQTVYVPDIGDFQNVDVIEVHVAPGDTLSIEDPMITLENDKASLDLPATVSGVIKEVLVKVGDKVNEGDAILLIEAEATQDAPAPASSPKEESAPAAPPSIPSIPTGPIPGAATYNGPVDVDTQLVVLGAGPGGYTAAFRASDLGLKTVLVERYPTLGGVCLNVGCIPSKALLHAAKVIEEAKDFANHGINFGTPQIDLDALREWKDGVVKRLTGGLNGLAKQRKVQVEQGYGTFLDPYHLQVKADDDSTKVIRFERCIIAAGSQAVKLPFLPEDDRIVDSTGALELRFQPKRMLVIGGGIIGLEMATVYNALGAEMTVVEMMDGLMMGVDRDVVKPFQRWVKKRYKDIMLETRVTNVEARESGLLVHFEGKQAPEEPQEYDMILMSVGRKPNGHKLDADKAGVYVDDRGFIPVTNNQMATNVPHIFAIGDIIGQPMLAHKAIHEARVAAEVCAGHVSHIDAKEIPSVAYTDPEVAWVGLTETEAKAQGINYGKGVFPWAASGRSLATGRNEGMTKVLFEEDSKRVLGAGIVGPHAGELIAEIALAIEMGADAEDIGLTVHPHPTLSETVAMAAEAFEGTITDLYMPKRK